MYKKEFDKLEKIPQYMLFYGNVFYLQDTQEKLEEKFKDENIIRFYYDDYDFEEVKKALNESSLFGGRNIVMIKHSKIPQGIEKLIKYANDNYLFFFYYGQKQPFAKKNPFGKNFVRFFEPKLRDTLFYIDEICKKEGLTLTKEAKLYIANSVSEEFIKKEIEKLSLYGKDLSVNDVKELLFLYKEESLEDLMVSILKGGDFFEKLQKSLEVIEQKRIIPALIRYVRELYEYNLYFKKTGLRSLEGYLGYRLPFDIEKQRIELCMKFKEKDYYELLKTLLEYELKMRKSEKNKDALFWEAMSYLKLFNSF